MRVNASPIKISKLGKRQRFKYIKKWRLERGEKKHISILKSFIVLQKSNYYLTRKKDKWQIIYITNARPAHIVPPVSHGIQRTNPPWSYQTASKKPLGVNLRFGCSCFCCDLRLEKWHVALHSFAVLVPPLPCRLYTTLHNAGWLSTAVRADLHWNKSEASPRPLPPP